MHYAVGIETAIETEQKQFFYFVVQPHHILRLYLLQFHNMHSILLVSICTKAATEITTTGLKQPPSAKGSL